MLNLERAIVMSLILLQLDGEDVGLALIGGFCRKIHLNKNKYILLNHSLCLRLNARFFIIIVSSKPKSIIHNLQLNQDFLFKTMTAC